MRLRIVALTLMFGLGISGLVSAQESGNWFSRWFSSSAEKKDKIDSSKLDEPKMPPSASASRARQAKADLERRQEVCLKLREIAESVGDDEMMRKAEQLEQRAFDLYLAATQFRSVPLAEAGVKKGSR